MKIKNLLYNKLIDHILDNISLKKHYRSSEPPSAFLALNSCNTTTIEQILKRIAIPNDELDLDNKTKVTISAVLVNEVVKRKIPQILISSERV